LNHGSHQATPCHSVSSSIMLQSKFSCKSLALPPTVLNQKTRLHFTSIPIPLRPEKEGRKHAGLLPNQLFN